MPWIGILDGETVIPEGVETGTTVTCPDCGSDMHPRGPTSDGRARHFSHHGGGGGGSCGGGIGESDKHRKMKSLAVSRLRELYPDHEVVEAEATFDVSETDSVKETRRADALVKFSENDPRLGKGLVVEVQHRNEGKDIEETEQDVHSKGYSLLWTDEDDYSDDRATFTDETIAERAVSVFPEMVPEQYRWWFPDIDLQNQRLRTTNPPERSLLGEVTHATFAVRWVRQRLDLAGSRGDIQAPSLRQRVTMPREFYEDRVEQYYRETPWSTLFDETRPLEAARREWRDSDEVDWNGEGHVPVTVHLCSWLEASGEIGVRGIHSDRYSGPNITFDTYPVSALDWLEGQHPDGKQTLQRVELYLPHGLESVCDDQIALDAARDAEGSREERFERWLNDEIPANQSPRIYALPGNPRIGELDPRPLDHPIPERWEVARRSLLDACPAPEHDFQETINYWRECRRCRLSDELLRQLGQDV